MTNQNLTLAQRYMAPKYEARRKSMFYKVLLEELGNFLASETPEGERFDWNEFKKDFNAEYKEFDSDQLLDEIFQTTPKYTNEQSVIDRYNVITQETKAKIAKFNDRENRENREHNRERYFKKTS